MEVSKQARVAGVAHSHYGPFKNDAGETIEGDKYFVYTVNLDDLAITEWRVRDKALFDRVAGSPLGAPVVVSGEIAARGNQLEHRLNVIDSAKS